MKRKCVYSHRKKVLLLLEREIEEQRFHWTALYVMFSLLSYYSSSRLCCNTMWIKSLHLLSSCFSEWFFILSSEAYCYYQSCVSWESVAGLKFLFSLFLAKHEGLRGMLSVPICLKTLTQLPVGKKKVINLSIKIVHYSFTIFKSIIHWNKISS